MKSYVNTLACRVAALFTLMIIICPLSVSADDTYDTDSNGDKWYYTYDSEHNVTTLTKHNAGGGVHRESLTTPATVGGHPVTVIGGNIFHESTNYPKYLTVSEGVTILEEKAFTNCRALVSVSLPGTLRSIGEEAFVGCSSLASIAIPSGVEVIPYRTFSYCTSLASVTIPASVTTIGNYAFGYCTALTSITIPNSVTTIGDYAFRDAGLTSVYFEGTYKELRAVSKGTYPFQCNDVNHQDYLDDIDFFHWRCTLTFDVQGHGTAPAPQTLWSNIDTSTQPADPEATGYTFGGWYENSACTGNPFEFGEKLLDNDTCYAKWTPLPNTITFDLGDKGTSIPDQTVYSGNKVTEPAVQFVGETGSEEGIEGWCTDENLTDPYDFEAEVDHSFTLYAKWAAAGHYTLTANEGGTATLTDAKGRAYTDGLVMPGIYTLTVTPQSGYSFTGSYALINPGSSSSQGQPIAGSSTKTYRLDLTQKDAEISVTFSTTPILSISVTTDCTATEGSYSLRDGHGNNYDNGSTVTPVGEMAAPNDDITLTVTKGASVGCAATIVNNGTKIQVTDDVTSRTITPYGSIDIELFFYDKTSGVMTLLDDDRAQETGHKNADLLGAANGKKRMVTLSGRTLYRDGNWNTLCLPFDLDIEGSALAQTGMTLMELDTEAGSYTNATGFEDGTLYLNFRDAGTTIRAGKPYIIKWKSSNYNISEPVFGPVTITTATSAVESTDGTLSFTGSYSPVSIAGEDRSILFLGGGNSLYYPDAATSIKSFRAYFQLNGITAGDPDSNDPNAIRAFSLNLGDDATEIESVKREPIILNHIYDLSGRRVSHPTKGLYIINGKKVVIK